MRIGSPARRLARGLTLLGACAALVAVGLALLFDRADAPSELDAEVIAPWLACAREARRQLVGRQIEGPLSATWDASGEAVDVGGITVSGPSARFACRVVHRDANWIVERLVVGEPR